MNAADTLKAFDDYILRKTGELNEAELRRAATDPESNVKVIDFDLATARNINDETPASAAAVFPINFAWRSVYVFGASQGAAVKLRINSKSDFNADIPLSSKDSLRFPKPIAKSWVHFPAQAGKLLSLLFLLDGEILPGNFVVTVTQTNEGTSVLTGTKVAVLATATIILPADANRKSATVQLQRSSTANAFIGSSIVDLDTAAKAGVEIQPGEIVTWKNTAALYAIAAAAGTSTFTAMEEA